MTHRQDHWPRKLDIKALSSAEADMLSADRWILAVGLNTTITELDAPLISLKLGVPDP